MTKTFNQETQQVVTVIGAGVVGLANAIALQQRGLKVKIIDKLGVAAGASFGNAGHFATEQVFPLADPAMLLKLPGMLLDPLGPFRIQPRYFHKALPWFTRFLINMLPRNRTHNGAAISALNRRSIDAWRALVSQCGCEQLLRLNGSLLVFEQSSPTTVDKVFCRYRDAGVAVKRLTGDEARSMEPALSTSIRAGLLFSDVGHTPDPAALCDALASHFVAAGGELIIDEIDTVQCSDRHISIISSRQHYLCDRLVVSAGAWSKSLAKQLGDTVPLETERGYHLMMPEQSGLQRPVASYERKFIITPMHRGTCLAGTVEFGGLDAPLVIARADGLLPHAKALLPEVLANAQVSQGERWMGFRPSLPDSLPVLGPSSRDDRVFFSFGHQHLGLTWSALTAQLLAELMQGERASLDISPYRANRF